MWLVNSLEEVTDEAVIQKSQGMRSGKYDWGTVFASG